MLDFVDSLRSYEIGTLPVPMSIPLYTCLESAEMISAPAISSFLEVDLEPSQIARSVARSDFPDAVEPRMTMILGAIFTNGI